MNALIRTLAGLALAVALAGPASSIAQDAKSQETQAQRQQTQPIDRKTHV